LVGFYIKFVKAKAIFTVPWSAKSPFSLYTTIFVFPAGEAKLGYLWLNFIGAMLTIVLSPTSTVCFQKEKDNIS
jgi:hypothetical protein